MTMDAPAQRSSRANSCAGDAVRKRRSPIWVEGSLAGEYVRHPLDLTSRQGASDLIEQFIGSDQPLPFDQWRPREAAHLDRKSKPNSYHQAKTR